MEGDLQLVDHSPPRRSPGGSSGIAHIYVIAWNECVYYVHESSTEQRWVYTHVLHQLNVASLGE